jgi:hypothetical protein
MKTTFLSACALAYAALAFAPSSSYAHHSFAMFDQNKQVTLNGVVREFQWTNPHSWLQLKVMNAASGEVEDWSIEMISTSILGRMGWKKNSLKPGDAVVVVINPVRNGAHGGNRVSVNGPDGHKIGGPPQ